MFSAGSESIKIINHSDIVGGNEGQDKSRYLTISEAAVFLNLKTSRLRYEIFHNKIPYLRIGKSIRFDTEDLKLWVSSKKANFAALQKFHSDQKKIGG